MASKKNILFSVDWYEVLQDYPAEVRLEVYEAIFRYCTTGTPGELKPLANMAFAFIRREIDYNESQYQQKVELRREAGRQGGRPRKSAEAAEESDEKQMLSEKANAFDEKQKKQMLSEKAKKADNDNEYDNDNGLPTATTESACGADDAAVDESDVSEQERIERKAVELFFASPGDVEQYCMANYVNPAELRAIADEVINDWHQRGKRHPSLDAARSHLANHIRKKINENRKAEKDGTTDNYCNGAAGTDARRRDFAEHTARMLSEPRGGADAGGIPDDSW